MVLFCELSYLYRAINSIEQEIYQKHGLVINEAMILCLLSNGELSSGSINEQIGLKSTHSSKLVKSLETKGFIVRHMGKEDKRKMFFELTESGQDKMQEIKYLSDKLYNEIKTEINKLEL
jgi:DNA-binding MarR family transcriptional regulator